jgi:hypothetical protein
MQRGQVSKPRGTSPPGFYSIQRERSILSNLVQVPKPTQNCPRLRVGLGLQHPLQQFHGQANDVAFAAMNDVQPIPAVLITERTGFAFPGVRVEILFELNIADRIHHEPCDLELGTRRAAGDLPKTEPAEDAMLAAADHLEHPPRLVDVFSFAENLPIDFGNRIASDDLPRAIRSNELAGDIFGFLQCKSQYQLHGALAAA